MEVAQGDRECPKRGAVTGKEKREEITGKPELLGDGKKSVINSRKASQNINDIL